MRLTLKPFVALAGWLCAVLPLAATAAPVQLCPGVSEEQTIDGRLLRHLAYAEAAAADLVAAPTGFAAGQPCLVHRAALADLTRLLAAADASVELAGTLRGISCFRGIERQRQVFCARIGDRYFPTAASRAQFVAPPGYSEHATGYAIDFGIRPSPTCPDVDSCIIAQPAGRWLLAHARDYGFELSFPAYNKQGVTWEPWHWRWVGTSTRTPGGATARAVFARSRTAYPAYPAIVGPPPISRTLPWPPFPLQFPRLPGI